tara:strand:+ start:405 stop:1085 length:681 start_codon:yes stop_codon:yes gene_type:complete
MKIENKLTAEQVKKLENLFANDFASPVFPLLAEHYYNIDDYYRAKKVCEIGLSKNTNNAQGMFVLAKIFYRSNDLYKGERLIQGLLKADPVNLKSLLLLFEIQKKLNRSSKTLLNTVSTILKICPNNSFATNWMQQNAKSNLSKRKKKNVKMVAKSIVSNKTPFTIQSKFQTFSMIDILVKQKHYQDALKGLSSLAKDETKKTKAEKYIIKINKIIKKENEKNISK